MSEQQQSSDSDSISDEGCSVDNGLETFITGHYEQQKQAGNMGDTDQVSQERTNNFFERAIKESQRMSMQVEKYHKRIDGLHDELGGDTFAKWRNEHASEVLKPEEVEAVNLASHQ